MSLKFRRPHRANYRRDALSGVDYLGQGVETAPHHVAIKKPVERRVALNRNLGKDDEIRLIALSLFDRANDGGGVGLVIAVGGVDLADGYAHQIRSLVFGLRALVFGL